MTYEQNAAIAVPSTDAVHRVKQLAVNQMYVSRQTTCQRPPPKISRSYISWYINGYGRPWTSSDVNPRIRHVHEQIAGSGGVTHVVDLAVTDAVTQVANAVLREHPRIRLLVNNAGVALWGRFEQVTWEEFNWVIDINFRATVCLTQLLLPALKAEPGSHLANVSSLFGLIAPAGQAAYAASKFAVRGFTEALRHELADNGIGVTAIHPGGIRTRIATSARVGSGVCVSREEEENAREQCGKLLTIDPFRAADIILDGIERRRGRVLIGWSATILDLLARLLPSSYGKILAAATRARRTSGGPERRLVPAKDTGKRA